MLFTLNTEQSSWDTCITEMKTYFAINPLSFITLCSVRKRRLSALLYGGKLTFMTKFYINRCPKVFYQGM